MKKATCVNCKAGSVTTHSIVKLEVEVGSEILFGMSSLGQNTELDVILAKYGLSGCRSSTLLEAESAIPRNSSSTGGDDETVAVAVEVAGSVVAAAVTATVGDGKGVGVQVKSTSRTKIDDDDDDDDEPTLDVQVIMSRR